MEREKGRRRRWKEGVRREGGGAGRKREEGLRWREDNIDEKKRKLWGERETEKRWREGR